MRRFEPRQLRETGLRMAYAGSTVHNAHWLDEHSIARR
jgi:hypothetical protein